MRFIIDGYNLLHAMGWIQKGSAVAFDRLRIRLLEWLSTAHARDRQLILVIFDGKLLPRGNTEETFREMKIRYSQGETADDLIEKLIQQAVPPKQFTIVSSDRRIKKAAERRGCVSWDCGEYLEYAIAFNPLQPEEKKKATPDDPNLFEEKPIPEDDDLDEWLEAFGEKR